MVTLSEKKWTNEQQVVEEKVKQLSKELDVSELFIKVCLQRGLTNSEEIKRFITLDENWFHDPFLLHDMNKGMERIATALENNEKITVYGDYDADGMTSTALLVETLDSLGANVSYYLPNRFVEGYGPNTEAFDKIIKEGTSLIITVDNGVAGHEAIEFAKKQEVDVIVTDHHELPEELPDAYAIIHPKHPEGNYPFTDLAGVGVALKVATALTGELPVEMLDLAAIGTVADLVSLTDENRAIVSFGLQMLENTQREGLLQLFNVMGKDPEEASEETIGFQIAPRLNAVGRLGDASPCVELLTTHEIEEARQLAEYVNEQNEERKKIVDEITVDVLNKLNQQEDAEVVVLADEHWHPGVLGIVASRVVEKTHKATLLFTIDSDTGIAKGSGRSIPSVNLYEALLEIEDLFTQFGGHHMAAGMSAEVDQLPYIYKGLAEYISQLETTDSYQEVDAYIPIKDLSIDSIKELDQLRPFGTDNSKPIIACTEVNVLEKRKVGAEGDHLKLLVGQENHQLDIISFQNGKVSDVLYEQQVISVAGYVEVNEWNGFSKPQMQMLDIQLPGPAIIDQRTSELTKDHFKQQAADYIFFNKNLYDKAQTLIPDSSRAILLETEEDALAYKAIQEMIIVDCPLSIRQFKETISGNIDFVVRCFFYKKNHYYLMGLPSREDFAKTYKYFAKHKNIDLQNEGHLLVQQLNMESAKVFLIVKVFLEAKFVIINNGILNIINSPEKKDLQKTKTFLETKQQIAAEELFLYSSFKEIILSISK